MNEIIAHDLRYASTEHILQTHATNPLLSLQTISSGIEAYLCGLNEFDSLFTVSLHKTRFYSQSGLPLNHNPTELLPTQNLPTLCEENSCMYLFSRSSFHAAGERRIGLSPRMYPISKMEAVDIDYEDDFMIAELLGRQLWRLLPLKSLHTGLDNTCSFAL
jgi:CMP-N-acetylneuraminic acid synthetase